MKPIFRILIIELICGFYVQKSVAQDTAKARDTASMQDFYNQLSPYGDWIDYGDYGYVWVPTTLGPDFYPYATGGYWAYSDFGWAWVSEYPWGWAPFHYGRWTFDIVYGWLWIPDMVWGPAWVCWDYAPGFWGWLPLEPGYDLRYYRRHWRNFPDRWTYVGNENMGRHDIYNYYGPREDNHNILNHSTLITNTYTDNASGQVYSSGPAIGDVQKYAGNNITRINTKEVHSPAMAGIENNQLNVYRPVIQNSSIWNSYPAPARVTDLNALAPLSQRKVIDQQSIKPYQAQPRNNMPRQNKYYPRVPEQWNEPARPWMFPRQYGTIKARKFP